MAFQRISQRDIAARANVHFTTVSLALRNSPALPEATRLRIQQLAEEMGYRPDPMLTALQAYRKTVHAAPHKRVIAWINRHKPASSLYKNASHIRLYRRGAEKRCEELGYRLVEFSLVTMNADELDEELRARGIQGLLLPPQVHNRAHFNFAWEHYSAVAFGHSLSRPRLHAVTNSQYSSVHTALRWMRAQGYRRIGFVTTHDSDERTDQNLSAAFLTAELRAATQSRIPLLVLPDTDSKIQKRAFLAWYAEHRPEAILAHYHRITEFMEQAKISYDECGLALAHLHDPSPSSRYAGIDQNDLLIGSSAVDMLVAMLHRDERGVPETPLRLLVEGRWVDGSSIQRRSGHKQNDLVSLSA